MRYLLFLLVMRKGVFVDMMIGNVVFLLRVLMRCLLKLEMVGCLGLLCFLCSRLSVVRYCLSYGWLLRLVLRMWWFMICVKDFLCFVLVIVVVLIFVCLLLMCLSSSLFGLL